MLLIGKQVSLKGIKKTILKQENESVQNYLREVLLQNVYDVFISSKCSSSVARGTDSVDLMLPVLSLFFSYFVSPLLENTLMHARPFRG